MDGGDQNSSTWVIFEMQEFHKTGVINDPLGQFHSYAQ